MDTGSFLGVKRPGRGVDHPPPSSAEVEGRVELYIYSPSGPSWPVPGRTLPLHLPRQPILATQCRTVKASDVLTQIFQFTNPYSTSKFTVPLLCVSLLLASTCFGSAATIRKPTPVLLIRSEVHNSTTVHLLAL